MARSVQDCRFRRIETKVSPGEQTAQCELLCSLMGPVDVLHTRVTYSNCKSCCAGFEPSEQAVNSHFASKLWKTADSILAAGGVPGCDSARAQTIRDWAQQHLVVFSYAPCDDRTGLPPYTYPCQYLGSQTGIRKCETCQSPVQMKVFACSHEFHSETTLPDCKFCRDYEPSLAVGRGIQSWAVGVTTAPRKNQTLSRTLDSLGRSGWTDVCIFAEPDSSVPSGIPPANVVWRSRRVGPWSNFLLALTELLLREPRADGYLICEDDVVFCAGLRDYLESRLWPDSRVGVVSLFTPSHQDPGTGSGFFACNRGWDTWGAAAFLFPNASARALLRHRVVVNHRQRGPHDGWLDTDCVVGQWCKDSDAGFYLHTPSLAQHIGETSAIWGEGSRLQGRRHAPTFPGEDCDIRRLMSSEGQTTP